MSEQEFPYQAWDTIAQQAVTVLGWREGITPCYRITPGVLAWPHEITTVFPAWYTEAQQREADAKDERETMEDARYG
jgi:hypothetical protein